MFFYFLPNFSSFLLNELINFFFSLILKPHSWKRHLLLAEEALPSPVFTSSPKLCCVTGKTVISSSTPLCLNLREVVSHPTPETQSLLKYLLLCSLIYLILTQLSGRPFAFGTYTNSIVCLRSQTTLEF